MLFFFFFFFFNLILFRCFEVVGVTGSCMLVQIIINHISDLVIKSMFFEIFHDSRGINLSKKKCMIVSCCICESRPMRRGHG